MRDGMRATIRGPGGDGWDLFHWRRSTWHCVVFLVLGEAQMGWGA